MGNIQTEIVWDVWPIHPLKIFKMFFFLVEDEEESCRQINQPDNGDFTPRQDVYLVDDTVRFTCDKGFDLVGSDFIECLDGGKWTDEEPICRSTIFLLKKKRSVLVTGPE